LKRIKIISFSAASVILLILFTFFCFPLFVKTVISETTPVGTLNFEKNVIVYDLKLPYEIKPQITDYVSIKITAKNTGNTPYPYTSIAINLSEEKIMTAGDKGGNIYVIQDREKIIIDGFTHIYHIYAGQNKYWRYDWSLEGGVPKNYINNITLEVPVIDGIDINICEIELKKRILPGLDSWINYHLKNSLDIDNINPVITQIYIFMLLAIFMSGVFYFLFLRVKKTEPRVPAIISCIIVLSLFAFSIFFMQAGFYTVKSYFDSYRSYILSARLGSTYEGFYNFERFIKWLDDKIPAGKNAIVLLKSEPVYIMSELAYNLYPADIKFIDIGGKTSREILDEINDVRSENDKLGGNYDYLVVLTKNDIPGSPDLELVDSYREDAGFLYRIR